MEGDNPLNLFNFEYYLQLETEMLKKQCVELLHNKVLLSYYMPNVNLPCAGKPPHLISIPDGGVSCPPVSSSPLQLAPSFSFYSPSLLETLK